MEYLRVGCLSLIALVFAVSAVAKARDLPGFARSVAALAPVRPGLVRPLASAVVAAEAAIPVLLVVPATARAGFALAALLLTAFSAAIAAALRRGRRTPCRCFGASPAPVAPRHLVRNALLFLTAAAGAFAPGSAPASPGMAVAVTAGIIGAILLVSFDEIFDLFAGS